MLIVTTSQFVTIWSEYLSRDLSLLVALVHRKDPIPVGFLSLILMSWFRILKNKAILGGHMSNVMLKI